jgi:hypothetical protein
MNFETIIVGIVAILYATVGVSYALKGNYHWAIVWASYASANFGLILLALKK